MISVSGRKWEEKKVNPKFVEKVQQEHAAGQEAARRPQSRCDRPHEAGCRADHQSKCAIIPKTVLLPDQFP